MNTTDHQTSYHSKRYILNILRLQCWWKKISMDVTRQKWNVNTVQYVVRKYTELMATPSQPPNCVRLTSVYSYQKMKEKS